MVRVYLWISFFCFFFFKQKTAYEMRIGDWSSDVCSSDLYDASFYVDLAGTFGQAFPFALDAYGYDDLFVQETRFVSRHDGPSEWVAGFSLGRASCRGRVWKYV